MKTIPEEEIDETIYWKCPYRKCGYENTDGSVYGIPDFVYCAKCCREIRVVKE